MLMPQKISPQKRILFLYHFNRVNRVRVLIFVKKKSRPENKLKTASDFNDF